jgi:hypothetical protein
MTLKTLKDLSQEIYENCGSDPEPILKQEAIRWVKEDFGDGWSAFKRFFNLTKEDLK